MNKKKQKLPAHNSVPPKSPFKLYGLVIHGKGRGMAVGMPTANLQIDTKKNLPKPGVYAAVIYIGDSTYLGVTNVGLRPTVDNSKDITVETIIINFTGDLYGEYITLELFDFIRPTKKMESLIDVKKQVEKDCKYVEDLFRDTMIWCNVIRK